MILFPNLKEKDMKFYKRGWKCYSDCVKWLDFVGQPLWHLILQLEDVY